MVQIEPLDATIGDSEQAQRDRDAQAEVRALVAQYDSLRANFGGVAVARLEQGSCRGCHIKLSSVEFDRVRHLPIDAVVHCEHCGRILIR